MKITTFKQKFHLLNSNFLGKIKMICTYNNVLNNKCKQ